MLRNDTSPHGASTSEETVYLAATERMIETAICVASRVEPFSGTSALLGPSLAIIDALEDMLGLTGHCLLDDCLILLIVRVCVH